MLFMNHVILGDVNQSNAYIANAVDFDGSTNFLYRGGGLTGISDSATGVFYAFIRLDGGNATTMRILQSDGDERARIQRTSSNKIEFAFGNSGGSRNFNFQTVSSLTASSSWISILASWDTNLASGSKIGQIYINDVSDSTVTSDSFNAYTIPYATQATNWYVGADASPGGSLFNGCMAEVFFLPGTFLDFSDVNNRRKFISSTNRPVNLGNDGTIPTGTAPKIYLKNPSTSYGTNSGNGGDFTTNGTFATASTSPSTS